MSRAPKKEQLEHFEDAMPDGWDLIISHRADQGRHPNKIDKRYVKKFNKRNVVINSVCKIKKFIELLKDHSEEKALDIIDATGWVESQLSDKRRKIKCEEEDTKPRKKVKVCTSKQQHHNVCGAISLQKEKGDRTKKEGKQQKVSSSGKKRKAKQSCGGKKREAKQGKK